MKSIRYLVGLGLVLALGLGGSLGTVSAKEAKKKEKGKESDAAPKIVPKPAFVDAIGKLAKDERVPVASSTLVEKGRGEDYYSVEKMVDSDPDTFWAEGAKGFGKDEWVAFFIPDDTSHIEITPGAGKEQFENFNRPKTLFLDIYLIKIKSAQDQEDKPPTFKWLSRMTFNFKDRLRTVREKVPLKLPELAIGQRTFYMGVLSIQEVYKGQFDDTCVAEIKTSFVWGQE